MCEANNLACEMLTSLVRPWFKNVPRLSFLMFSSMDALEIGKRNSIQRALKDYFTAWYLFSVKQLNVSNHFLSLSHFTLSFISFRSFHRIRQCFGKVKRSFSATIDLCIWV